MEKNLFKMNFFKKSDSLIFQVFRSISSAVQDNWDRIRKSAIAKEEKSFITVIDTLNEQEIKVNTTVMKPSGLVVMVDEDKVSDCAYMEGKLREVLKDIFLLNPPISNYFSKIFKSQMTAEFDF